MQSFLANQITAALIPLLPKGYPISGEDINERLLGVDLPDETVFGGVAFLTTSPKRILVPTVFVAFQGGTFKGFSNLWNDDGAITLFYSEPQPIDWKSTVVYPSGGDSPYELTANKVNSISAESTDNQYPSAKAVHDAIQAGGGSCPLNILVTGENLGELQQYGPTTRSGLAEYFGVTEGQLQDLTDGKYCGLVGPNNIVFWLTEKNEDRVTLTSKYHDIEIYCLGDQWALGYVWD